MRGSPKSAFWAAPHCWNASERSDNGSVVESDGCALLVAQVDDVFGTSNLYYTDRRRPWPTVGCGAPVRCSRCSGAFQLLLAGLPAFSGVSCTCFER